MSQLERISISIDRDLLLQLDGIVERAGHGNRSEAVRDLIRGQLVEFAGPETLVVATLTLTYDDSRRELPVALLDAASDHHDQVLARLHVVLQPGQHLEVLALKGPRRGLESLAAQCIGMKGVLGGRLVVVGADD
ncbi:MAG: nickel-responsive transcriptional regulator NikR [Alphaproteobacteria bacterium]|nr:nickel-responsive transcriptional regulator NikR [Alphaproteobacteria bacterium]